MAKEKKVKLSLADLNDNFNEINNFLNENQLGVLQGGSYVQMYSDTTYVRNIIIIQLPPSKILP